MGTGALRRHHGARRVSNLESRIAALRNDSARKSAHVERLIVTISKLDDEADDLEAVLAEVREEIEASKPEKAPEPVQEDEPDTEADEVDEGPEDDDEPDEDPDE